MWSKMTQWGGYSLGVCVLFWMMWSSTGWYHLLRLQKQVSGLRADVACLQRERDKLQQQISCFDESNPERAAFFRMKRVRELLQRGRPGEVIYRVVS